MGKNQSYGIYRSLSCSSPAFTNVPLIGPILAATIGRLVRPTVRMHEEDWDGSDYSLYSPRLEPRGPGALPPPMPKDEYSLGNVFKKEANIFAEYTGLYGFVAKSAYQGMFPNTRVLRPAGHKRPHARATDRRSLHHPAFASCWLFHPLE
jgi:hypothetical protein